MEDLRSALASTFFDASGRVLEDEAAHQAARASAGISTVTACLELHGVGHGGSVVFQIQLRVNPNTYPFLALGGSIGGDICNEVTTRWVVTGGSFGPHLVIEAKRVPLGNAPPATAAAGGSTCATSMSIVGFFQAPDSYAGTYGTLGSNSDFSHTTLFKGWHACP